MLPLPVTVIAPPLLTIGPAVGPAMVWARWDARSPRHACPAERRRHDDRGAGQHHGA